ncbi:Pepco domain-containing protein [Sabulicella rubraurantiaca]|uniref:Pepco domain-containing protein n=1 Tax=Sabulicella rubraurantiaca TaxID=2811429 RepID=UPI001A976332|nr:hypothetical protein [Sabulicella rubraurantiaca]
MEKNLQWLVAGLGDALAKLPGTLPQYSLTEVEVSVVVSAEGSVSLLGTGGKTGVKGRIKLKFEIGPASTPSAPLSQTG